VGAVVYVVIYVIGKGKLFVFVPQKAKVERIQPHFENEAVENMETAITQANEVLLQTEDK
jgi:hypothetical protein